MAGFTFLVAIVLLGVGMNQNIRYGDELSKYYPFVLTLISGFGAAAVLIGLVMTTAGSPQAGLILGGLVVMVGAQLPALKQANEAMAEAKERGMKDYKSLGPVPVFIRLTLVGLGKVGHILLTCTLIGIPLYRMMVNMSNTVDAYCAQVDLREQLAALKAQEAAAQAEKATAPGQKAQSQKAAAPEKKAQSQNSANQSQRTQSQKAATNQKPQNAAAQAENVKTAAGTDNEQTMDAKEYYELGLKYITGDGVAADMGKACEYLAKAADGGIGSADFYLGHIFFTQGEAVDVNDADFGAKLSQLFMGGAMRFGRALESGDDAAIKQTVETIAGVNETRYNNGPIKGVFEQAMGAELKKVVPRLAERKDAAACYALGQMYVYGVGVEQDYIAAKQLFESGAANGHQPSEKMLTNPIFDEDDEEE